MKCDFTPPVWLLPTSLRNNNSVGGGGGGAACLFWLGGKEPGLCHGGLRSAVTQLSDCQGGGGGGGGESSL